MRQFQFNVQSDSEFRSELLKLKQWLSSRVVKHVLFQVYTEILDIEPFEAVCRIIDEEMPDSECVGCSSNGCIFNGDFCTGSIVVVCTVFEYQTTGLRVMACELTEQTQKEVAARFKAVTEENPWIKACSLMLTIRGMSMTGFCDELSKVRSDVSIFGGGAFNLDINEDRAFVYSKESGFLEHGVVFILMGGEDFYIETTYITGWKPLGRELLVTDAKGDVLKELNHQPAFDIYYRYLHIHNDESFFNNTLEFPFLYETNGIEILRAPIAGNKDGSLTMTADIEMDVKVRIAYGDPWTILSSVRNCCKDIYGFAPEAISVFSCAARRTFWGNEEIGKETLPFQQVASTSGFYTSGEFLRTGRFVNQHNVTLVVAAMREGPKREMPPLEECTEELSGRVSMINRLATFIKATTDELMESTDRLAAMAITDGLTGLYNRVEIQRRIIHNMEKYDTSGIFLIMIDIDNFKKVNDTYGHDEGDKVIIALSNIMLEIARRDGIDIGRWGGEEFMVLIKNRDIEYAKSIAEEIRSGFAARTFDLAPSQTVSVGITRAISGETPDAICSRVDKALYSAKNTGKNKIIIL